MSLRSLQRFSRRLEYGQAQRGEVEDLCIPEDANSPCAAYLFLDYVLDARVNAKLTDYIWYLSAVQGVNELPPEIDSEHGPFLASDYPFGRLVQDKGDYIQDGERSGRIARRLGSKS